MATPRFGVSGQNQPLDPQGYTLGQGTGAAGVYSMSPGSNRGVQPGPAAAPEPQEGMSLEQLELIKKSIGPGGQTPVYGAPDLAEKHRMAFGRAKDRAGKVGRASLTSLRENLAGRGVLGSGIEGAGTAELSGDIAGNLSDVVTEQASEEAGAATHAANQNFAAQRDAADRQTQMQQSLLSLIRSAGGLYDQAAPANRPPLSDTDRRNINLPFGARY